MKLTRRNHVTRMHSGLGHEACLAKGRVFISRSQTGLQLYVDSAEAPKRRFFVNLTDAELKRMIDLAPELTAAKDD